MQTSEIIFIKDPVSNYQLKNEYKEIKGAKQVSVI